MIFRGFHRNRARILDQFQVELTELEKALLELDKSDEANEHMRYRLKSTYHHEDCDMEQKNLLQQLRDKQKEYGKVIGQWAKSSSGLYRIQTRPC